MWLERNLAVTQSLQTITTTLAVTHRDRDAALDILRRVHAFAEGQVRASLAELWRRRIAALEGQLSAERDVFVRTPIFEILAQHQRAAVVTSADEAVAARLVSPPMVGISPEVPNRPLLLVLLAAAAPAAALLGAACLVLVFGPPRPRPRRAGRGPEPILAVARARED
ncbi:hypothetical protein ACE7GA_10925 [Roseomonas sp. CCTCC AB2023176]|uniref:hypothetical protein n=1 Tax=Roseomonas sp. CCTCC AB2023176 TaxID=3342640 RepID=UPI0035D6E031